MYLNAIIFSKLQKMYQQIADQEDEYYLTFAPITLCLSNFEFNFLNPNASADEIRQNAEYKMAFAKISNTIVRDEKIFPFNNDEMLEDAYEKILNEAILIDTTISADEKTAYDDAKSILFINEDLDPTKAYSKYKEMAAKYTELDSQILDLNIKLSENTNLNNTSLLQQKQELELKKNVLLNEWLITADKDKIEKALKIVSGLNERTTFKNEFYGEQQNLKSAIDTERTINSNMEYLPTFCLPNNVYQYSYNGWKKIIIQQEEIENLEKDAKSFLGEPMYQDYSVVSTSLITKIEFEYLILTIQRNWFNKKLINSRFWRFKVDDNIVVSDGVNPEMGVLPAYVDKFVIVRRIMQYMDTDPNTENPEVQVITPPIYRFAEIAKLKNISMLKNIKPEKMNVSKIRMTRVATVDETRSAGTNHIAIKSSFLSSDIRSNNLAPQLNKKVQPKNNIILHAGVIAKSSDNHIQPQSPSLYNILFTFQDVSHNAIVSLDVLLTHTTTGNQFKSETDNAGKVTFTNMASGSYHMVVSDNEIFEDFESTYTLNAHLGLNIVLTKRANPKFDMWLIGAVNYRFPKLPNPLNDYTYS